MKLIIVTIDKLDVDDYHILDFFHSEWDCDGRKVHSSEVPPDEALDFLDANNCTICRFDVVCTKHGQMYGEEPAKLDEAFDFLDSNDCLDDVDAVAPDGGI